MGRGEFRQLEDYVHFLRERLQGGATDNTYKRAVVKGLLIADQIRPGDERHADAMQEAGTFDIRTWNNLLTTAESMHKEFLDAVTQRAPQDDPRIVELKNGGK